jgi:acyl dehydratase
MIYFEDVELDKVSTAGPYLLTEQEIREFSAKWDPFDFHLEDDAAGASIFGGIAASGSHLGCIFNRLGHDNTPILAIRAVVEHRIRYVNAARPGDELMLEGKNVWVKDSGSRPDIGIVGGESRLLNQTGDVVLEVGSVVFVARKP